MYHGLRHIVLNGILSEMTQIITQVTFFKLVGRLLITRHINQIQMRLRDLL